MGEYAKRKKDGVEIKIGTCESMYYIRFEDRKKVIPLENSIDITQDYNCAGLRWRLPFPDEDGVEVGDYGEFNRSAILTFDKPTAEGLNLESGTVQLSHESGLLLNVACYHGTKLPAETSEIKAFWNGKDPYPLRLMFLKSVQVAKAVQHFGFPEELCFEQQLVLFPVIGCRHCRKMWVCEWKDIWEALSAEMRERCFPYRSETFNESALGAAL